MASNNTATRLAQAVEPQPTRAVSDDVYEDQQLGPS